MEPSIIFGELSMGSDTVTAGNLPCAALLDQAQRFGGLILFVRWTGSIS